METLLWLVIMFFVGRRWWKKNPEKTAAIKEALQKSQAGQHPELAKILRDKPAKPMVAAKPAAPFKPAVVTTQQNAALKARRKTEKQFQEL